MPDIEPRPASATVTSEHLQTEAAEILAQGALSGALCRATVHCPNLELVVTGPVDSVSQNHEHNQRQFWPWLASKMQDSEAFDRCLNLLSKPEWKRAAVELDILLSSDGHAAVLTLTELIGSRFAKDQSAGARLVQMLSSKQELDRDNASRLLHLPDFEQRNKLLDLPQGDPISKRGLEKVLDLLLSRSRNQQALGYAVVEMLCDSNAGVERAGRSILGYLGGDAQQQTLAETILKKIDDPLLRTELLHLQDQDNSLSKQLLNWLNGTPEQVSAAISFLKLNRSYRSEPVLIMENGRPELKFLDKPPPNKMLPANAELGPLKKMIDNPALAGVAQKLLFVLPGEQVLNAVSAIYDDDKSVAKAVLTLANSNEPNDRKALMNLFASSSNVSRRLALFLAGAESRQDALDILTRFDDPADRKSLTGMFLSENFCDTGKALLNMVKSKEPDLASMLLKESRGAEACKALVDIFNKPEYKTAAQQIKHLLQPNGGAGRLAYLLTSKDPQERQCGAELLQALNTPKQAWLGRQVLSLPLIPGDLQTMLQLYKSNANAADALAKVLTNGEAQIGAKELLALLRSEDVAQQRAGQHIVSMFSKQEEQKDVALMLTQRLDRREWQRLSEALRSDREKEGAKQVVKLLQSSNDFSSSGREILGLLTSPDKESAAAGAQLLGVLGDEGKREYAKTIVSVLSGRQAYLDYMELAHPLEQLPRGNFVDNIFFAALLQTLISSQDSAQQRATVPLMSLWKSGEEGKGLVRRLLQMLRDSDEQAAIARAMINSLDRPAQYTTMMKLLDKPESQGLARSLMAKLSAPEASSRDSARAFLDIYALPGKDPRLSRSVLAIKSSGLQTWASLFENADTKELAKSALDLSKNTEEAALMTDIMNQEDHLSLVEQLASFQADKKKQRISAAAMETLVTAHEVRTLVAISSSSAFQEADAHEVVSLLEIEATDTAGITLVDLIGSPNAQENGLGTDILKLMRDQDGRAAALTVLTRVPQDTQRQALLDVLKDQHKQIAAATLLERLEQDPSDASPALNLLTLLSSRNLMEREEGQRLLDRLNDHRYKAAALRLLGKASPSRQQ